MFVRAADDDLRRERHLDFYVGGDGHKHRVRETELHVQPLAAGPVACAARVWLEGCTVADADEVERDGEALGHADDGVMDERAREAPH